MFFDIHLGSVLGQICEKMEYGKRVEKGVGKESTRNEVCGRGGGQRRGGEASPRSFARSLHYRLARPATSERGAADRLPPLPPTFQQPMNRIFDDSMTR